MSGLPRPITTDQRFYAALCDLMAGQNDLLAEIRDRLPERPAPDPAQDPQRVELREPDPPAPTPLLEPDPPRKPRGRPRKAASTKEN